MSKEQNLPEKFRVAVLVKPRTLEIHEFPLPPVSPRDVLLKQEACNICTTDYQQYAGLRDKEPFPKALGHEVCGIVVAKGSDVGDIRIGERVSPVYPYCGFCDQCRRGMHQICSNRSNIPEIREAVNLFGFPGMYGFADYFVRPAKFVVKLNAETDPAEAAFLEPVATVVSGIKRLGIRAAETVVVLGGGTMGIVNALIARMYGARVIVSEPIEHKRETARAMGFETIGGDDPVAQARLLTDGTGADAVIAAVGISAANRQALEIVKRLDGRILFFAAGYPAPAGPEDAGETYTFKVSIQGNEDEIACISTMKAMEDIEAKTGGRVTFDVFPASELGDYMQIFGEVQQGSIDIANLALSSEYSAAFDLPLLPYLASSADELKWMFTNKDSYVWNLWSDELQGFDMKLINVTGNGFMGFASTLDNLDYEALCDFTVQKNIKTRVPPMDLFVTLVTDMGLNPTSVSYSETYSALQTGVIDAWTGGNPESNYVHFRDIIKNYADLRYGYEVTATIMNSKKYDSLPDDYKAIFDEAFTAVAIDQIDQKQDIDAGFLKQLEEAGIEIYTPTEAQFEAMAEHIRRVSWPKYAEMWGEDVLTALQDDYKNMR